MSFSQKKKKNVKGRKQDNALPIFVFIYLTAALLRYSSNCDVQLFLGKADTTRLDFYF